jgi:nitrite reductase (NADH) large subunit
MKGLVAAYKCEWKEAVTTPALRARFQTFVNTDEGDDTLEFVGLREQKMPKPWN